MSNPYGANQDPNLNWDGKQWLRWDGTQWLPAGAAPATAPVAASSPSGGRGKTGWIIGGVIGCIVIILVIVAAVGGSKKPTNSAPPSATAACGTVGATGPGGGKIFYVDMSRAVGSQCFEAAPDAWNGGVDPSAGWGCEGTDIPGAAAQGIGTGGGNTAAIVAGCVTSGIAAKLADNYAGGGQTDWFLPSKDELNQLCKYARNQSTTVASQAVVCDTTGTLQAGFAAGSYWSSSQFHPNLAWDQSFFNGTQIFDGKSFTVPVRPVRAF